MGFVAKWFRFGRNDAYDRAIRAYEAGLFEEAIDGFREVIDTSSDPASIKLARFYTGESFAQLGQAALRAHQFASAATNLRSAMEMNPTYPDLFYALAQACRGLGDPRGVEVVLNRALEINPRYAAAILLQGILMYEQGDVEGGLARIQVAVDLEPSFGGERYLFALDCHYQGRADRLIANLEALQSNDAQDANAHAKIGDTYAKKEMWLEAAQEYGRALEIAPNYADIRVRYAQALLELQHLDSALAQVDLALQINGQYADAWAYRGIVLRRLHREAEAVEAFQNALASDPQHAIAQVEAQRRAG